MKPQITFLFSLLFSYSIFAQCPLPVGNAIQDGNNINAMILNGGDLFWDGDDAQFLAPSHLDPPVASIFAAGLWMAGFDQDEQLHLAAQSYGRIYGEFDYSPGPIPSETNPGDSICSDFNMVWKATSSEIELHKADFEDNGIIDNPIASIFGWPGRRNFYQFYLYNEIFLPEMDYGAPFHDKNGNNIYEPEDGEYPHPPKTITGLTPASITWTVFNDAAPHENSGGLPINAEIHLTSWSFDCGIDNVLNNTIFTSHTIFNKSEEALDSFHVALWVDFDLGCYFDDYIGSYPEQDAFFVYNSDGLDGLSSATDCAGVNTYGYTMPAQSVQLLNKQMDYFTFHNELEPIPGTGFPDLPDQYYNYMTGRWKDGHPFTEGGYGYNFPVNTPLVQHVFPDDPRDELGWSLFQLESFESNGGSTIASHHHGAFLPNQKITLDIAYTYHHYPSYNEHLEIFDLLYLQVDQIQQMYDMRFNGWCGITTDTKELEQQEILIHPNPSSGIFSLEMKNIEIKNWDLFDASGRLIKHSTNSITNAQQLDFSFLSNGIYILRINTSKGQFSEKLIIQK